MILPRHGAPRLEEYSVVSCQRPSLCWGGATPALRVWIDKASRPDPLGRGRRLRSGERRGRLERATGCRSDLGAARGRDANRRCDGC